MVGGKGRGIIITTGMEYRICNYLLVLLLGSRGPSTVTLIALVYVAT